MKIYLIGFMGSGKSFFGKKMARAYGLPFVDLDQAIEMHYGKFIHEIFADKGEEAFRKMERDILHRTEVLPRAVISCGGGTACFFDNMDWMNEHGLTVYLRSSVDTIAERLEKDTQKRPLIEGLEGEALKEFIRQRLEQREVFYLQAQLVLDTEQADVVEELRKWVEM